jgi:hypothetical protein
VAGGSTPAATAASDTVEWTVTVVSMQYRSRAPAKEIPASGAVTFRAVQAAPGLVVAVIVVGVAVAGGIRGHGDGDVQPRSRLRLGAGWSALGSGELGGLAEAGGPKPGARDAKRVITRPRFAIIYAGVLSDYAGLLVLAGVGVEVVKPKS